MKNILALTFLTLLFPLTALAQASPSCVEFQALIKSTYTFKPSKLSESAQNEKAVEMDKIWEMAKANQKELVPCLRAALETPGANQWFRFDGSNLLVSLDPTPESKRVQIRAFETVDLDDTSLGIWVRTLARRGAEGFDVSAAGARWLEYPKAQYSLTLHGGYAVKSFEGALFVFGSMDEAQATPALLKIINQPNHPGREAALEVLMLQSTDESLRALRAVDKTKLSTEIQRNLQTILSKPQLITPRSKPKTSREEFVRAFEDISNGKWDKFFGLVAQVQDGEKDVVAVMKPEDLPLVRKVRRLFIANANQHAIEYYDTFTSILMTMVWKSAQ